MARSIQKPSIVQLNKSIKQKALRQLGYESPSELFLLPLTSTTTAMPKDNDIEGDVPSRKRISLACQRCRKRKIKCEPSGTSGDGNPCIACQSAKSSDCQYLRVSSGVIPYTSAEVFNASWNYSLPVNEESSFNSAPAHDLSQYSINNLGQTALSTGRTQYRPQLCNDAYGRMPGVNPAVSQTRNYQPASQQNAIGTETYSIQNANNSLSYPNNAASSSAFVMQDVSPTWMPSSMCGLSQMETAYSQNNPIEYEALHYQSPSYVEDSAYLPELSPLATHLPAPATGNGKDRFLPAPVQSYLTANIQSTPETDSHDSSSGGTENSSEASTYDYTSSIASHAIGGAPINLPDVHGLKDTQSYAPLPTLDPPRLLHQEGAYSASSFEGADVNSGAHEFVAPRAYRLLQPQPRRASRSFLNNPGAGGMREARKSVSLRRQERQNMFRHH